GRKPRADQHVATAEAEGILRSRRAGGDRAPRPDRRRYGSPLSETAERGRGGAIPLPGAAARSQRALRRSEENLRRPPIPGTGDEAGNGCGRFYRRGGQWIAPRDCDVPQRGDDREFLRQDDRRHGSPRLYEGFRRTLLQADRGLRKLWLSRKPCSVFRAARLCLLMDQALSPRRFHMRPAQFTADGLLRPRAAR